MLAWCLLCSPMLWISANVRGATDSLGSALLLSPLLLWAPLGRATALLMLPIGLAYLAYFRTIGSLPDEYFWFTVLGTHSQEAWEYLQAQRGGDALWVLGWFVPACIASGWLWRHLPRPQRVPHPQQGWTAKGRQALRATSLLIVGLWLLVAVVAGLRGHDLRKVLHQMDRVYPLVLLESLLKQQAVAHSIQKNMLAVPAFTVRPTSRPRADVVVLVIGESATAQRWSLLGYQEHDTNAPLRPYLRQGQLHSLSVLANGNNTAMTVPVLMSGHRLEDFPPEGVSTYLDWARAAGFRTWSLSNQGHSQGGMETFYQAAFRHRSDSFLSLGLRARYDEALTEPLLAALGSLHDPGPSGQQAGQPLLITLHTYGSHHTASRRYPASHALWSDAPYDNSIAYSSHLLAQWIGLLQQHVPATQRAVLMYISDHGVGLPDCGVNFHHSTGRSAFEVPLLFWGNTAFWSDQPDWQVRLAQQAQSSPGPDGLPTVDNRIFAATVADLLGYAPRAVLSYPSLGAGDAPPVPVLDGQPYAQRALADACHLRATSASGSADASSTAPPLPPPAHD